MKYSFRRTHYRRFGKTGGFRVRKKLPLPLVIMGACAAAFLCVTMIMDAMTPDRYSVDIIPEKKMFTSVNFSTREKEDNGMVHYFEWTEDMEKS